MSVFQHAANLAFVSLIDAIKQLENQSNCTSPNAYLKVIHSLIYSHASMLRTL